MGNNDLTKGIGLSVDGLNRTVTMRVRFDASKTPIPSGDTFDIIDIPAKTKVERVDMITVTPEGAADTIDIGDQAAAAQYGNDISLNEVAGTAALSAETAKKYYHTANTIRCLANAALAVCVVDFFITMIDFRNT